MIFYDFEVFKYDWLAVFYDSSKNKEKIIINDKEELEKIYQANKNSIFVGFNNKRYDQYIFKAILSGFDPKKVNDYIVVEDRPGFAYSDLFNEWPMYNYDVFNVGLDRGLKSFEGFMGGNVKESSVPFNIDRKLNFFEIEETVQYCKHDVYSTVKIFMERFSDFEAHVGLIKYYANGEPLNLHLLSKTKVQLSSLILNAKSNSYYDEFDIDVPSTLDIKKYTHVVEWYLNEDNRRYYTTDGKKNQLDVIVAGVPHVFGWGGVHGAREQYKGEGYFLNIDVASMYPSLMIRYDLGSRSMKDPKKYEDIYHQRLKYKAEKNPLQAPLKIVLNGTYGAMKYKNNDLYDPRQANRVCIYGQLLLLDLIEKLEPHCELIQSNTDGILIKLNNADDYELIDDICYEWEQRVGLVLEFDEYVKVYQKDVNNYVIVDADGNYKSKGAYVKKLTNLDYDLAIVNKALVNYMIKGIPIEDTINNCDSLIDFQMIARASSKYSGLMLGDLDLGIKTARVFADTRYSQPLFKVSKRTNKPEKVANTPMRVCIVNDDVTGKTVPAWLDRQYYIEMAYKRLYDFVGGDNLWSYIEAT